MKFARGANPRAAQPQARATHEATIPELATNPADSSAIPLCVDLDGTLLRSDLLLESALALLRRNPLYLFAFPAWLLRGRACLKREIARRARLDVATLPYDPRMLELLGTERARRQVVLCTASDDMLATAVAEHVGCFHEVMASAGSRNLAGPDKAAALVARFGDRGFDYAGNEMRDLAVWKHARRAFVVNAADKLVPKVVRVSELAAVIPREHAGLGTWLKALRLHQWLKNALVFVPLLAAHLVLNPIADARAVAAFLIFSVCASSVYLLNDMLDLDADRRHPRKRMRPDAPGSGRISSALDTAESAT
ncbi:MAG: hypothetical protein ACREPY_15790 [Rhodanobacteraceae bacterium]